MARPRLSNSPTVLITFGQLGEPVNLSFELIQGSFIVCIRHFDIKYFSKRHEELFSQHKNQNDAGNFLVNWTKAKSHVCVWIPESGEFYTWWMMAAGVGSANAVIPVFQDIHATRVPPTRHTLCIILKKIFEINKICVGNFEHGSFNGSSREQQSGNINTKSSQKNF